MPWAVYASTQKSNGFPNRDEATERALTDFYERLPGVRYEGHTGQIDNLLTAIETASEDVLIDGHQGRGTLELITAIYKSAITGARVTLPLEDRDPFCTRDGLLAAGPALPREKGVGGRLRGERDHHDRAPAVTNQRGGHGECRARTG